MDQDKKKNKLIGGILGGIGGGIGAVLLFMWLWSKLSEVLI